MGIISLECTAWMTRICLMFRMTNYLAHYEGAVWA